MCVFYACANRGRGHYELSVSMIREIEIIRVMSPEQMVECLLDLMEMMFVISS